MNTVAMNAAIRAKFPDPDEAAARVEVAFLSPGIGPHATITLIREHLRGFQRDTINILADCLVDAAARFERTNSAGTVTVDDLKREAQALRDYADTLLPAGSEADSR